MSGSAATVWVGPTVSIPAVNSNGNTFEEVQVATAGQTLFTLLTFTYTPNTKTIFVYKNGVMLRRGVDYTETSNSQITLAVGAALSDKITFEALAIAQVNPPVTLNGLPAGGAAAQYLKKNSGSDYDTSWATFPSFSSLLDQPRVNIASAATINLAAIANTTRNILITGNGEIDGFQVTNGQVWAATLSGSPLLKNSVNFVTNRNTDIQGAPNATMFLRATADNVMELISYVEPYRPAADIGPVTVRQCAQYGSVDANGDPNFLSAGAGLNLNLAATATPLILSYAGGESVNGSVNIGEAVAADSVGVLTLAASNTSYVNKLYGGTWDKTLAPPQYGKAYDRTAQSVLQFAGAAGATVFLDDFGNTWTAAGGAKVQVNQIKFGSGGLGGAGASNALNGTTDYINTADVKALNKQGGSWSMRCWAYSTALPGAGNMQYLMNAHKTGDRYGVNFGIYNNAGTIRWGYELSSNGTSADITGAIVVGTSLPAINTWYFVEVTYDALAGIYRLYINGVQESSTASASKVCSVDAVKIGVRGSLSAGSFWTGYIDKPEFLPYCDHPAGSAYAVPTAAPSVLTANYASDFFDIQQMKMFKISVASTAAGANPTFANVNKLYVAEADTSGAAVTAVRNYYYKARYESVPGTPLPGSTTSFSVSHNLGFVPDQKDFIIECLTADAGHLPGTKINLSSLFTSDATARAPISLSATKTQFKLTTGNAVGITTLNAATFVLAVLTPANWRYKFTAQRGW